ncbi:putative alpha/beta superfamily hydrolase [Cytobacillus eiseniae]|uniref:Alpha/beta superfamily hydrolase n=1 Tax=Cytobacillus eiseniae TaxID=762947 RepID=A0ABS4RHB6_9BACI|nr:alpha/beta hydrolase-fold protein [Cytobacillus eiseniae]MBP2242104.1 putative alpha/beta superfamily hydrolase [Cytobacillus eiseniae]
MSLVIHSTYTNYTYSVDVFVPEVDCPKEGYPIIYVLDGLSYFDFAKKTMELQSKNMRKTKVNPSIVVGIQHEKETMRSRRFYDFTAPALKYTYPKRMHGKEPEAVGGAIDFHLFIEKELKPLIYDHYAVNVKDETLFGHSLGGYYALWNLFHHSRDFKTYIALSPSIWWNDYELVTMAEKIIADDGHHHTLFIGVGELEDFMVTDAQAMYEKLKAYGLNIAFYEALDENHASVVPTVMSRAFRFISGGNE